MTSWQTHPTDDERYLTRAPTAPAHMRLRERYTKLVQGQSNLGFFHSEWAHILGIHDSWGLIMINPWLTVPAADYKIHMEHESVRQGEMIRKHLTDCLIRFEPKSLLYLGAGIGNGLEGARAAELSDILAVDVNPEYLAVLRKNFGMLTALRTEQCSFPEGFSDPSYFQLAYGALFFEYVDLETTLAAIATHLTSEGHLVALLQQPSEQEQMTRSGVTSLEAILPIMSLHTPSAIRDIADRLGVFRHVFTEHIMSPCGKPFCEIIFQRT